MHEMVDAGVHDIDNGVSNNVSMVMRGGQEGQGVRYVSGVFLWDGKGGKQCQIKNLGVQSPTADSHGQTVLNEQLKVNPFLHRGQHIQLCSSQKMGGCMAQDWERNTSSGFPPQDKYWSSVVRTT